MKKLLFILITIPLIFSSCEKEEENPSITTTTSTTLILEQTMWDLKSYILINNLTGFTETTNFPTSGVISLKWTFFDNGTLIETLDNGFEVEDFPFTYSYFPGNNRLNLYDDDITEPSNLDFITYGDMIFTIIEHTSNNLTCEWTNISEESNVTYRGYFDKVN
tara:strand:+ start:127 stop:615 length:489 start_codon:yes stop_codon:yes gene_type:complete